MKPFDINAILQNSRNIMLIFGLWPEKSPTAAYKLRAILAFFLTISLAVFTLIQGVRDFNDGNYGNGSFTICTMFAAAHAAYKVWLIHVEKPKFYKIIDNLTNSSVTTHEDNSDVFLQKRLAVIKVIFNFQLTACTIAGFLFSIGDFIFEYKSSPRILSILISQDNDNLLIYICTWSYYGIAGFYTGYIVGSFEGLMLIFLSLGVVQLKILRKQITQAVDTYPSGLLNKDEMDYYNELVNKLLKECILRHNAIERYILSIENKFTYGYLVQLLVTIGATGLVGFSLIVISPTTLNFSKEMLFFSADLMQIFLLCILGTEIIYQSEMVRHACYMSNWWRCNSSVRKTLYIIMERSKRPLFLTSGKFSIISLQTFVSILHMSLSYFTVLKKLYAE